MTDLHSHILWGLDDGAANAKETLKMLRQAERQGIKRIAATTHAYPSRPFNMRAYTKRLDEARDLCESRGLDIELLSGAEIAATFNTASALRSGFLPTLANSDYALIELWHNISWQQTYEVADSILKAGFIPIFSHIERYSCFVWEPKRALKFRRETGAILQMNAETLLYKQGLLTKRFVKRMLAEHGIDVVASDMHNAHDRPPNLGLARRFLAESVGESYARRLTSFEVKA